MRNAADRYALPQYLLDIQHEDFIADIPGQQIGAIAVAEELPSLLDPDDDTPMHEHLNRILTRAKHLSASRGGRGRDDLVEVTKTMDDEVVPGEFKATPRRGAMEALP